MPTLEEIISKFDRESAIKILLQLVKVNPIVRWNLLEVLYAVAREKEKQKDE